MRRGFSIVELIISCLILGVLAAVGLNAYVRMRDDAILSTARARLQQLTIAKEQFISEYGRLEAQAIWANPAQARGGYTPVTPITGQPNTFTELRYNLLKRYIERPQATFADVMPRGTIATLPNNVFSPVTGQTNTQVGATAANTALNITEGAQ